MSLAENLRRLRRQRFLTQEELAARADVTQVTVSRIETGYAPRARTVRRLAAALGVEPSELADPEELEQKKGAA